MIEPLSLGSVSFADNKKVSARTMNLSLSFFVAQCLQKTVLT